MVSLIFRDIPLHGLRGEIVGHPYSVIERLDIDFWHDSGELLLDASIRIVREKVESRKESRKQCPCIVDSE